LQGNRDQPCRIHGTANRHTLRVELGDLKAERGIDLIFHQDLKQPVFCLFDRQSGQHNSANLWNSNRAITAYGVALPLILCRQKAG
jgi:hypothetical protein